MPSATLAQWGRGERLRRAIGVYRFLVDGEVRWPRGSPKAWLD
jgi:hypothetical protein